ncbi:hypothetical protein P3L10_001160 [Capsicum annuum]
MEQLPPPSTLSVTRRESELIVPATVTPREIKYLSDIDDQRILHFHTSMLIFYKCNPSMEGIAAKVIKDALSKTLVFYYPLAEDYADVELEMLGESTKPPCPYLEDLLYNVPGSDGITDCPLMLIQLFYVGLRVMGGPCGPIQAWT